MTDGIIQQGGLQIAPPAIWTKLPALADRLGIKPGDGGGEVWVGLPDGRRYDLIALVNAVLDRLDAASGTDYR